MMMLSLFNQTLNTGHVSLLFRRHVLCEFMMKTLGHIKRHRQRHG